MTFIFSPEINLILSIKCLMFWYHKLTCYLEIFVAVILSWNKLFFLQQTNCISHKNGNEGINVNWLTSKHGQYHICNYHLKNILHSVDSSLTAQKIKFSIQDFFSKCYQIRRFLQILSHLLKKSLMENLIFCAVFFKLII